MPPRAEISLRVHRDLVASVFPAFPARVKNHEPVPLQRHVRGVNALEFGPDGTPATCRLSRRGRGFAARHSSRVTPAFAAFAASLALLAAFFVRDISIDRYVLNGPRATMTAGKTNREIFHFSWK